MPLDGMRLWLKADCATNPVDTWPDQSPAGGNNAVQNAGANQPTLVTDAINGRPTVHFAGSAWLTLPNVMNGATQGEIFLVVKAGVDATSNP